MNFDQLSIKDNKELQRFEMEIEESTAILEYKPAHGKLALIHTEVPVALEGKGVAAALVKKVFEHLEESNIKIIPVCPYVVSYLKRHPEWNRIVDERL